MRHAELTLFSRKLVLNWQFVKAEARDNVPKYNPTVPHFLLRHNPFSQTQNKTA